jgi:hypothetical protein
MMNLFSIVNPIMTGFVLAVEIGLLAMVLFTRKEMRFLNQRRVAELAELHDAVAQMRTRVDELSAESRERGAVPVQSGRRMTLNLHPRAEALRMLRRGSDEHTVSATLNLPLADVALLQKVSQILCAAKE